MRILGFLSNSFFLEYVILERVDVVTCGFTPLNNDTTDVINGKRTDKAIYQRITACFPNFWDDPAHVSSLNVVLPEYLSQLGQRILRDSKAHVMDVVASYRLA